MLPTLSQAWLRAARAVHELTGIVEPGPLRREFYAEIRKILGPAIGMSDLERWETMSAYERSILVEALEERSALVYDGARPTPTKLEELDEDEE